MQKCHSAALNLKHIMVHGDMHVCLLAMSRTTVQLQLLSGKQLPGSVCLNLFKTDNFYIFLSVVPYSWLICISHEKQRGNQKKKTKKKIQGILTPHFTLGSTADKN